MEERTEETRGFFEENKEKIFAIAAGILGFTALVLSGKNRALKKELAELNSDYDALAVKTAIYEQLLTKSFNTDVTKF